MANKSGGERHVSGSPKIQAPFFGHSTSTGKATTSTATAHCLKPCVHPTTAHFSHSFSIQSGDTPSMSLLASGDTVQTSSSIHTTHNLTNKRRASCKHSACHAYPCMGDVRMSHVHSITFSSASWASVCVSRPNPGFVLAEMPVY